jgi:hypothetical protein
MATNYRNVTEKVKAELSKKTGEVKEKQAKIEELEAKLADTETRSASSTKEDVSIGQMPHNEPIEGYAADLLKNMKEYVADQIREIFPERGVPIRSQGPARTERPVGRRNAVMAYDREGNAVYRRRDQVSDPFSIPEELCEPGWDQQWVRISVHGWEDVDNQVAMQENGWRPISANRPGWEGRFMPPGYKGAIQKSGLMLMERPMSLTQEAKEEERRVIRGQTETQRQQFGMALPAGFESTPAARAATGVRVGSAEPTSPALRPKHEVREAMEIDV